MKKGLKEKLIDFNNKANIKLDKFSKRAKKEFRDTYEHIKSFLTLYKTIVIITTIVVLVFVALFYVKLWKEPTKYTKDLAIHKYDDKKQIGTQVNKVEYKNNISYSINYPSTGNRVIDTHVRLSVDGLKNSFKKKYEDENSSKTYYELIDYESYLAIDDNMSIVLKEEAKLDKKQLYYKVYPYNYSLKTGLLLRDKDVFKGDYKKIIKKYVEKEIQENYTNVVNNYSNKLNNSYDYKYAITDYAVRVYFDANEIVKSNKIICIEIPFSEFKGNTVKTVSTKDTPGKEIIVNNIKLSTSSKTKGMKKKFKIKDNYTKKETIAYAKNTINLYDKDNVNSKIITPISKGEEVQIVSEGQYGFDRVKYNNRYGYVVGAYLSSKKQELTRFNNTYIKTFAIEDVTVYSEPSTSSKQVGTLKDGEKVVVFKYNADGWDQILYKGERSYILSCYLSYFDKKLTNNLKVNPQRNISNNKPLVALTFDGGPNPAVTYNILDLLIKYNAAATFFDTGSKMYLYPEIVKREENYGNEVASLGFSNIDLKNQSKERIINEVSNSEEAFNKILGHNPTLFRPPYGNTSKTVLENVNYPLVTWTIDSKDDKYQSADKIIKELEKNKFYGNEIILFHSNGKYTTEVVEHLLKTLTLKGYQFATVTEVFSYSHADLKKNTLYSYVIN